MRKSDAWSERDPDSTFRLTANFNSIIETNNLLMNADRPLVTEGWQRVYRAYYGMGHNIYVFTNTLTIDALESIIEHCRSVLPHADAEMWLDEAMKVAPTEMVITSDMGAIWRVEPIPLTVPIIKVSMPVPATPSLEAVTSTTIPDPSVIDLEKAKNEH